MAELHVMHALRNKRAELAWDTDPARTATADSGRDLTHIDATMRLFDPDIKPNEDPSQAAADTLVPGSVTVSVFG